MEERIGRTRVGEIIWASAQWSRRDGPARLSTYLAAQQSRHASRARAAVDAERGSSTPGWRRLRLEALAAGRQYRPALQPADRGRRLRRAAADRRLA
jgi:hypothetical protein